MCLILLDVEPRNLLSHSYSQCSSTGMAWAVRFSAVTLTWLMCQLRITVHVCPRDTKTHGSLILVVIILVPITWFYILVIWAKKNKKDKTFSKILKRSITCKNVMENPMRFEGQRWGDVEIISLFILEYELKFSFQLFLRLASLSWIIYNAQEHEQVKINVLQNIKMHLMYWGTSVC